MASILGNVKNNMDRYIISKKGEQEAILMSIDDYEGWLETLEIMSSKKTMDDIKKARKELEAGKGYDFYDVFKNAKVPSKKRAR